MLRQDHVLVQLEGKNDNLSFAFRSKNWSIYSALISIVLLVGTFLINDMDSAKVHFKEYLVPGGYVATALFIWSSIYSYFTKIELEIDKHKRVVEYRKSNFFGTKKWEKGFDNFIEVRIWRPGNNSFFKVVLRMKDKQEIPLGTSEAGILNVEKARKLAEYISKAMNIPVIEEAMVRSKF